MNCHHYTFVTYYLCNLAVCLNQWHVGSNRINLKWKGGIIKHKLMVGILADRVNSIKRLHQEYSYFIKMILYSMSSSSSVNICQARDTCISFNSLAAGVNSINYEKGDPADSKYCHVHQFDINYRWSRTIPIPHFTTLWCINNFFPYYFD